MIYNQGLLLLYKEQQALHFPSIPGSLPAPKFTNLLMSMLLPLLPASQDK